MSAWQTIATCDDFGANGMCDVLVGSVLVLLVRQGVEVRAVEGLCPHAFARLSAGRVDEAGHLNCPRHLARFSLDDGACLSGWAVPPLKRYAVRIEVRAVQVPDPLVPLD